MKSIWQDSEVKDLFDIVEKTKNSNRALKNAFEEHAKKYIRKCNSVRNYYYHEIDNLKSDTERCKRIGIDLDKHIKNKLVPFTKEQEEKFLRDINELTSQGMSVRSACFKLGGGDVTLTTRLQNKFQNLKNQREVPNNIISFRENRNLLTDSDINSLFMGLVKLVKKNANEDAYEKIQEEKRNSQFLLKKAYTEIGKKEREILKLKSELEDLRHKNLIYEKAENKQEKLKNKLLDRDNKSLLKIKA